MSNREPLSSPEKGKTEGHKEKKRPGWIGRYAAGVLEDAGGLLRLPEKYRRAPDEKHIDVLDGLRVLFILIIAWYHIWQQSWLTPVPFQVNLDFLLRSGYEWVDAMLLLSGFCLFLPYAYGKRMDVREFFKKRVARIVPSYYLCVLLLLVFTVFPQAKYPSAGEAVKDIAAHLTFTHSLFTSTYIGSPINGVLWTLSVEAQFYVLFPLLCICFKKRPLVTWCVMTLCAFVYRYFAGLLQDTAVYINQLPAFLDVYANGFAAAMLFRALRKRLENENLLQKLLFTGVFVVSVWLAVRLMKGQAAEMGIANLRLGQMNRRWVFSCTVCALILSAAFSLPLLRFLLGNRVMRFLSLVTFQFYMYHQAIAVWLKEHGIPASLSPTPNFYSEQPWQTRYTLLCFFAALVLSVLLTFLFERPVARCILKKRKHSDQ